LGLLFFFVFFFYFISDFLRCGFCYGGVDAEFPVGCFISFLFCFHLTATGVWNVMVEKHACLFKRPQGLFYFLYYFQWSYSCLSNEMELVQLLLQIYWQKE